MLLNQKITTIYIRDGQLYFSAGHIVHLFGSRRPHLGQKKAMSMLQKLVLWNRNKPILKQKSFFGGEKL